MKNYILLSLVTLCIAFYSSAVVAKGCDPAKERDEVKALALNMYFEARGDGKTTAQKIQAMQMVGEVTLNRVASDNYPNSICGVVYQSHQFSWTTRKDKVPHEEDSWLIANIIANDLVAGDIDYFDNQATHFINPSRVDEMPRWTRRLEVVAKTKNHIFYTDGSLDGTSN